MVEYSSEFLYIDAASTLCDKITRIDSIIDALLTAALDAALSENITEYQLDDGQTKIKAIYRGTDAIFKSINVLERTKQIYVNRLNGRTFRLIDSRNLRRGR